MLSSGLVLYKVGRSVPVFTGNRAKACGRGAVYVANNIRVNLSKYEIGNEDFYRVAGCPVLVGGRVLVTVFARL